MKGDLQQSHSFICLHKSCNHCNEYSVINELQLSRVSLNKLLLGTYLVTVYWTHFSSAFLAFPWILVATFRLLGGLAVSELTMLSTEDVLLDRACSWGRLLVNSSICVCIKSAKTSALSRFSHQMLSFSSLIDLNTLNTHWPCRLLKDMTDVLLLYLLPTTSKMGPWTQ